MADILSGEKSKKYIRLAVWMLRKKLGEDATPAKVNIDLAHSANPVVQFLCGLIGDASQEIKEDYQRNTVRELGELLLWILGKDTGYRDILWWTLKQICDHHEEIERYLDGYVQEPPKWYVNVWHDTKESTRKLQKKKLIPKHAMSPSEEIFVPSKQVRKLNKLK